MGAAEMDRLLSPTMKWWMALSLGLHSVALLLAANSWQLPSTLTLGQTENQVMVHLLKRPQPPAETAIAGTPPQPEPPTTIAEPAKQTAPQAAREPMPEPVTISAPPREPQQAIAPESLPMNVAGTEQPTQAAPVSTPTLVAPPQASAAPAPVAATFGSPSGPDYHRQVQPVYPALARRQGWQGTVILQAIIDEAGQISDLEIVQTSGYQVLDRSAMEATLASSYRPAVLGGRTMSSLVEIPVRFVLR